MKRDDDGNTKTYHGSGGKDGKHTTEHKDGSVDMKDMLLSHAIRWKFPLIKNEEKKSRHIVFYVGSSEQNKRWDKNKWIDVIQVINLKYPDKKISVLTGNSDSEKNELRFISKKVKKNSNVFFYLLNSLEENLLVLQNSELIVSHDTYPIHFASLLSLPVVGIYLSTNPIVWGSYNNDNYTYLNSPLKCSDEKKGTGNYTHFHNSCPNIEKMRNSISANMIVETIINKLAAKQNTNALPYSKLHKQ